MTKQEAAEMIRNDMKIHHDYLSGQYRKALNMAIDALLEEQEAKTGHWIEKEDYAFDTYYDCSVCGESWSTIEGTPWENGMNYCPHCGAKMEGR